jgi:hypothetical protein
VRHEPFKQLTDTREVFKGRIEQIKNAEPLPFTDQERSVYSRLMGEAEKSRQQSVADLAKTATTNGYLVEQEGSNIRLRDAETNTRYPDKFASQEQAIKFINESGRSKGIDLDGGGNNMVPPSAVAGGGMSAPDPQPRFYEVPHQFAPNTAVSKIQSLPRYCCTLGHTKARLHGCAWTTSLGHASILIRIFRCKLRR